jgi:hypothetical protein
MTIETNLKDRFFASFKEIGSQSGVGSNLISVGLYGRSGGVWMPLAVESGTEAILRSNITDITVDSVYVASGNVINNPVQSSTATIYTPSIGSPATIIVSGNSDRKSVSITHDVLGGVVYIGFNNLLTNSNGQPCEARQYWDTTALTNYTGVIYGFVPSGVINIRAVEYV